MVQFLCFALLDSFLTVPRVRGPVFMSYAPKIAFDGIEGYLVFMFCSPVSDIEGVKSSFHVLRSRTRFGRYQGVGSYFHILCSQTHFLRYRGRRPGFLFCDPGLIFSVTEDIESRFHVLLSRTSFWRY
jgi:hypothetical protein